MNNAGDVPFFDLFMKVWELDKGRNLMLHFPEESYGDDVEVTLDPDETTITIRRGGSLG